MKKRILVFPAGSEVGLEVFNAVSTSSHFELIGGSSVTDHAEYLFKELVSLPHIDSDNFFSELDKLIEEKNIDVIYPTMDIVNYVLSQNLDIIKCRVIVPSFGTVSICHSKSSTYSHFVDVLPVPIIYKDPDTVVFPIFGKPDQGYGSRGVKFINNLRELRIFQDETNNPILLEYLPGEEFTVDCFSNSKGDLLYVQARRRTRIRIGISVRTEFYDQEQNLIFSLANRINDRLEIKGAWFFQLKRDNKGTLKLLEVGLRIAGSSGINRVVGVNLPLLSIFDCLDYKVEIQPLSLKTSVDRAFNMRAKFDLNYDTLFIDYDDCIILNGKVNPWAIKLVILALNKRKKIVLISRHKGDLEKDLKKYRLFQLFDSVIHLTKGELKSDFITSKGIFLDDSFSERMEVLKVHNIPVFSPDTIPLLIDNL